jgi:hypothetical protein
MLVLGSFVDTSYCTEWLRSFYTVYFGVFILESFFRLFGFDEFYVHVSHPPTYRDI